MSRNVLATDTAVIRLIAVGIPLNWALLLFRMLDTPTLLGLLERQDTRWSEVTAEFLEEMTTILPERQRMIIRRHFGIGCDETTLAELAREWNISRACVRQKVYKGIRTLGDPVRIRTLAAILEGALPREHTQDALKEVLTSKGLDTPIEALGLTVAASRVVRSANILTVRDIYRMGTRGLSHTPGCGPAILKHILAKLEKFGFAESVSWEGEKPL